MHKALGGAVLLAALLPAGALTARAQTIRWGAGAGLQMPTGTYGEVDKLGWVAGVGATYRLGSGKLGVRGEVSYGETTHDTTAGSTKVVGGMASLVYALGTSTASTRPYLMGGVGFYSVDVSVTGFGSASESKVGFGVGAGVSFKMGAGGRRWFAETRYTTIGTSGASTTFLPIVVGISLGK
jgi:opacity protein-like surface antigen